MLGMGEQTVTDSTIYTADHVVIVVFTVYSTWWHMIGADGLSDREGCLFRPKLNRASSKLGSTQRLGCSCCM